MQFRKLRADEIDCRIGTIKATGLSLLLYKDARCDMNILDEVVGAENWQRNHVVINGNLFCNVGIKVNDEWIWKQDVGTESYTEKEKGECSDSFKRACFNWGIGRELYTAPFIWFNASDCNIKDNKCFDKFTVEEIDYNGNVISKLIVVNEKTGKRFTFGYGKDIEQEEPKKRTRAKANSKPTATSEVMGDITVNAEQMGIIKLEMLRTGVTEDVLKMTYNVNSINELTEEQANNCINRLKKSKSV